MDGMQLKVRAAFRRRPEACRIALRLPSCIPMQSQAQSWVETMEPESVNPRSGLVVLCLASQVCSKAPGGTAVVAKEGRKR